MRHIPDGERRRRLARRHRLATECRAGSPLEVTRSLVGLHATDAASVYLAVAARTDEVTAADIDQALYVDRSMVKLLAMRRTIFALPRDLLPAALSSAGARTAEFERRRTVKDLAGSALGEDPMEWLLAARDEVMRALRDRPLTTVELRAAVPRIDRTVLYAPGTRWGGEIPVAPRVLAWLGARGDVVRGPNDGGWWVSRPLWATWEGWLDGAAHPDAHPPHPPAGPATGEAAADGPSDAGEPTGVAPGTAVDEAGGYRVLVDRWLHRFGPGTETDLVWWLGATKAATRRALREVGAQQVTLGSGQVGWVAADDPDPEPEVGPWAALLPVLDPTAMGWKERGFYLAPEVAPYVFDSAGNAGTTAWVDGRIVGSWVQGGDGRVEVVLCSEVSTQDRALLDRAADRLTRWLDGRVIASPWAARQRRGERLL